MINTVIELHKQLEKGYNVKILTDTEYKTFINKSDIIVKVNDRVLKIFRANQTCVALNGDHIVMACINKVRI